MEGWTHKLIAAFLDAFPGAPYHVIDPSRQITEMRSYLHALTGSEAKCRKGWLLPSLSVFSASYSVLPQVSTFRSGSPSDVSLPPSAAPIASLARPTDDKRKYYSRRRKSLSASATRRNRSCA